MYLRYRYALGCEMLCSEVADSFYLAALLPGRAVGWFRIHRCMVKLTKRLGPVGIIADEWYTQRNVRY
jgi:hypothetical protein